VNLHVLNATMLLAVIFLLTTFRGRYFDGKYDSLSGSNRPLYWLDCTVVIPRFHVLSVNGQATLSGQSFYKNKELRHKNAEWHSAMITAKRVCEALHIIFNSMPT